MPSRRVHLKFDDYLVEYEDIPDTDSADTVHDRMDGGLINYGLDRQGLTVHDNIAIETNNPTIMHRIEEELDDIFRASKDLQIPI